MTQLDREPGDLQHAFGNTRRPVREGQKPNDGHARVGEAGLRRSTSEPAEQGKTTSCGGRGGKCAAGGEHRTDAHAPDSEQELCMSQRLDGVRRANQSTSLFRAIHPSESRMRSRAHTDLCGARSVMIVPTATVTFSLGR